MGFLRTSWESLRTPPGQQAPRVFQAALQQPRLDADNGPAAQAVLINYTYIYMRLHPVDHFQIFLPENIYKTKHWVLVLARFSASRFFETLE